MKIEINIDIEAIVREEIRHYIRENIVINNISTGTAVNLATEKEVTAATTLTDTVSVNVSKIPPAGVEWEFAAKPGKRRSKAEIALHQKEVALGRRLTPEEKGETSAHVEIDTEKEEEAKQNTKKELRIKEIADTAMAEAKEELANEQQEVLPFTEEEQKEDIEVKVEEENKDSEIPKADNLDSLNSMFS